MQQINNKQLIELCGTRQIIQNAWCNMMVDTNAAIIAKISVTSPIVINVPTTELLAGETKSSFV